MRGVLQDIRYGLRQLRNQPGFTAVVVITLAVGIGANASIFSVANWFLLRPLPVRDPAELTYLAFQRKGDDGWSNGFSYMDLEDIRSQGASVFANIAGDLPFHATDGLTVNGKTEPITTDYVTGNFFETMGVRPELGRLILPTEGAVPNGDPVLVLSHSFWTAHFGADPNIVGKNALVNGRPVTIVGIAPEGFHGTVSWIDTQGYLPLGMAVIGTGVKGDFLTNRQARDLLLVARLKPGTSLGGTRPVLETISHRLSSQDAKPGGEIALRAFRLQPSGPSGDPEGGPASKVAGLFLALAAIVLLIACANVTSLLLVRATGRQREMALRQALGAARARLIRQLLTESVLLALVGSAAGMLLGWIASSALSAIRLGLGPSLPFVVDIHLDWRVLAYGFGAALFTAIAVGIVPALRASRRALVPTGGQGAHAMADGRQRLRSALVVAQLGASLLLLTVAGLFAHSLAFAARVDLGFDPHHVVNLTMDPHEIGYGPAQGLAFYSDLLERVRTLPGIQSASLASCVPMGDEVDGDDLDVPGYQPKDNAKPHANFNTVSSGYFDTMGIPLLKGRDFRAVDNEKARWVAIVNQAMAERFWPNLNPVGQVFTLGNDPKHSIEIVGVAKNSRNYGFAGPIEPYFYIPLTQHYTSAETLQVRTTIATENVPPGIVEVIHSSVSEMPVFNVQTMTGALRGLNGLLPFQLGAVLTTCCGILALTLAIVGVYGVISYAASQRTYEIGIRMALGAQPGAIMKMILRHGLLVIALGLMLGLLLAFAAARLLEGFLVGVQSSDPLTYGSVSVLLISAALLASYIPAWRATKVDPMVALRYE
ncbi:MAG TPA: ABC transporter permease [Terriglobales bacterium]|nr:ABC transporter permease [Terriglobales bacterium]